MPTSRSIAPSSGTRHLPGRLLALVDAFARCRVAVVGDIVADEFLSGQISRVSREAPVLILRYDATRVVPGGAGNAANNVAALGGRVDLFGLVGRDEAGRALAGSLPRQVNTPRPREAGRLPDADQDPRARRRHSLGEAADRPDRSRAVGISATRRRSTPCDRPCSRAAGEADAVLLSDYGYGLVTPELARARQRRPAGRPDARARAGGTLPPRSRSRGLALQPGRLPRPDRLHAERARGRAAARRADQRRRRGARAGRADAAAAVADAGGARHARQPRHGALRAAAPTRAHPDLRHGRNRGRHRRRRHRDGDDDARARSRRVVLRGRAAGELRRRASS